MFSEKSMVIKKSYRINRKKVKKFGCITINQIQTTNLDIEQQRSKS
jgi:hypothetical protein